MLKNEHVYLWKRGFFSLFTKYDHKFKVSLAVQRGKSVDNSSSLMLRGRVCVGFFFFSSVWTFNYKLLLLLFKTCKSFSSPDLPQVFKSMADHSSIRLSFCSLPAKIPLVTLLAGLLLFLFDGLQGAFGGYVYTYAVKSEVDLSSSHAAYLNSLFWVGRSIS